jgi:shikimate 5-dehydrogenase
MAGYKEPGFQDRVASAAKARENALARLKAKPPVDPAVVADRIEKARLKEVALAQRAAERAAERAAAAEAARVAAEAAAAEAEAKRIADEILNAPPPQMTEEEREAIELERKLARDAKYAARKARKKG